MEYYRCNDCGEVFDSDDAIIRSENITDNYYEYYCVCPKCKSDCLTEISEAEYEEVVENDD